MCLEIFSQSSGTKYTRRYSEDNSTMNKPNKKYVTIVVAVVLIGAGVLFFSKQTENVTGPSSNNLYPETTISHGHGLAVDVKDSNKLYIATHYGLLVLMNEKDLFRIGKSRDDFMGFSLHPTDPNIFFTSGHSSFGGNLGFQKSEDGGVTWKKVSDGINGPVDFHAMAVSPINPDLIYGWYQGDLQRSADQGKTWEIIKDVTWANLLSELQNGELPTIALSPADTKIFNEETIYHLAFDKNKPETVYALTDKNSLYKSTDTGATWNKIR